MDVKTPMSQTWLQHTPCQQARSKIAKLSTDAKSLGL